MVCLLLSSLAEGTRKVSERSEGEGEEEPQSHIPRHP